VAQFGLRHEQVGLPSLAGVEDLGVLVVDDNSTNRHILRNALSRWLMRAVVAEDGASALAALRSPPGGRRFALVVLDALMPGMDGFTVAEKIKAACSAPPPIVLMLSSADRHAFADRCDELAPAAFLEKPISRSGLRKALATALGLDLSGPEASAEERRPPTPVRPLDLLLAEDTPANQKVVSAILDKRGHAVTVAHNGREAVDLFQSQSFDAAILDVQMPTMDGLQATAAIRSLEEGTGQRLPIIAMTAHAMTGDRDRCLAAGVDAYIAKPIDATRLVELVESLAARPSREGTSAERALGAVVEAAVVPPVFDLRQSLARLGGDMGLFRKLVEFFREDCPQLVQQIRDGIEMGEPAAVERAAHSLKGLAASFSAEAAVAAALRLEECGQSADLEGASSALAPLEAHAERLCQALAPYAEELDLAIPPVSSQGRGASR
jgi:two-component system sensor histidine kinase/response regulator